MKNGDSKSIGKKPNTRDISFFQCQALPYQLKDMAKVEIYSCSLITESHIKPDNEVVKIIP